MRSQFLAFSWVPVPSGFFTLLFLTWSFLAASPAPPCVFTVAAPFLFILLRLTRAALSTPSTCFDIKRMNHICLVLFPGLPHARKSCLMPEAASETRPCFTLAQPECLSLAHAGHRHIKPMSELGWRWVATTFLSLKGFLFFSFFFKKNGNTENSE